MIFKKIAVIINYCSILQEEQTNVNQNEYFSYKKLEMVKTLFDQINKKNKSDAIVELATSDIVKLVNQFLGNKVGFISKPSIIHMVFDSLKGAGQNLSHIQASPVNKTILQTGDVRWGKFITKYLQIKNEKTLVFAQFEQFRLYSISGFSDSKENKQLQALEDTFKLCEKLKSNHKFEYVIDGIQKAKSLNFYFCCIQKLGLGKYISSYKQIEQLSKLMKVVKELYPRNKTTYVMNVFLKESQRYYFVPAIDYTVIAPLLFSVKQIEDNSKLALQQQRATIKNELYKNQKAKVENCFNKFDLDKLVNPDEYQILDQIKKLSNVLRVSKESVFQKQLKDIIKLLINSLKSKKKIEINEKIRITKLFKTLNMLINYNRLPTKKARNQVKLLKKIFIKYTLKERIRERRIQDDTLLNRLRESIIDHFILIAKRCQKEDNLEWFTLQKNVAFHMFKAERVWDVIEYAINMEITKIKPYLRTNLFIHDINKSWALSLRPHCAEDPSVMWFMMTLNRLFEESGNATLQEKAIKISSLLAIDVNQLEKKSLMPLNGQPYQKVKGSKPPCKHCQENLGMYQDMLFSFEESNIDIEQYVQYLTTLNVRQHRIRKPLYTLSRKTITNADYSEVEALHAHLGQRFMPNNWGLDVPAKVRREGQFEGLFTINEDGSFDYGPLGRITLNNNIVYAGECEQGEIYEEGEPGFAEVDEVDIPISFAEGPNGGRVPVYEGARDFGPEHQKWLELMDPDDTQSMVSDDDVYSYSAEDEAEDEDGVFVGSNVIQDTYSGSDSESYNSSDQYDYWTTISIQELTHTNLKPLKYEEYISDDGDAKSYTQSDDSSIDSSDEFDI